MRCAPRSSAGIFGELKTLPIREDHPAVPDSPFGATKLGAEKHCLAYAKLYDLEAICLRIRGNPRWGDVRYSLIDISGIRSAIRFEPQFSLGEGLGEYMDCAKAAFKSDCP